MINIQDIRKSYGALQVLKGVNLEVKRGEVVSIVGSSGAGKTTLLQILGTLDKPDSGSYSFMDKEISTLREKDLARFRNEHIGFVFQFHQLLPEFTAIENVCMPGWIGNRNGAEVKKEAGRLLELLGLSARMDHKPNELSGGEQQRVAVARALINNPDLVLADEPSGNLDSTNAKDLHQLFFDLRKELNQTFVIVTHNEELANLADRKLVMKDGVIL